MEQNLLNLWLSIFNLVLLPGKTSRFHAGDYTKLHALS